MPLKYSTFLFVLIGVAIVNLLFLPRGPWLDEAMLLENLERLRLSDLFAPFPLYDQAAPPGQTVIALVIASAFGADALYFGLRIVSLVAFAGIAVLIAQTFRDVERPYFGYVFLCLLMSCTTLMMQAVTIKHYVLDAAVSSAVLVAGIGVLRRGRSTDWVFLIITSLAGFLFSFISIVAVSAVVFALGWDRTAQGGEIRNKTPWRAAVVLAGLALVFLGYKLIWIDPITHYQLTGYPEVYEKHIGFTEGFSGSVELGWNLMRFVVSNRLLDVIDGSENLWATQAVLLAGFITLLGLSLRIGGETGFVARVAICAILAIFILNVAGKLPIPYERHLSFYQPFILILASLLLSAWIARLARPTFVLILLGALAVDGVIHTILRRFDDVPGASSFLASDKNPAPGAAIWLSFPAQPAFVYARHHDKHLLGLFDPTSGAPNWIIRGGGRMVDDEKNAVMSEDYPDQMLADIAGENEVWLVISHHWQLEAEPFLVAAASDGWECKENEEPAFSGVRLFLCDK